jgi:hypothetical protein
MKIRELFNNWNDDFRRRTFSLQLHLWSAGRIIHERRF